MIHGDAIQAEVDYHAEIRTGVLSRSWSAEMFFSQSLCLFLLRIVTIQGPFWIPKGPKMGLPRDFGRRGGRLGPRFGFGAYLGSILGPDSGSKFWLIFGPRFGRSGGGPGVPDRSPQRNARSPWGLELDQLRTISAGVWGKELSTRLLTRRVPSGAGFNRFAHPAQPSPELRF